MPRGVLDCAIQLSVSDTKFSDTGFNRHGGSSMLMAKIVGAQTGDLSVHIGLLTDPLDTIVRLSGNEPGAMAKPALIIGISGASGAALGVRALQACRDLGVETHLIVSKSAVQTLKEECGASVEQARALATETYSNSDIGAAVSSGSFKTLGMLIAPCSIRTLSDIGYGGTDNLLSRAADVQLKERRRVVLMLRETPLHAGHLRAMMAATENGAIVMPPVPAFYHQPKTIDDIVNQTVGRALDLFDIDAKIVKRWRSDAP